MATYKEIRGTQIEAVATDPSNPVEGQVWYNTTSNVLKGQAATTAGSWATGGNLNTARSIPGGIGIQTAALAVGGYISANTAIVEQYNGTNWTEVNDLNSAVRGMGTSGTVSGGLAFFGDNNPPGPSTSNKNEEWNGTNWTETTDGNTGRRYFGGVGVSAEA